LAPMRVLFAGTPEVAVPSLRAVAESDHDLIAVLTRPPAPVGRRRRLTPSPVHQEADRLGLPVVTSNRPHDPDTLDQLRELAPEAVAVVAYGGLIRSPALELPPPGWFNLHSSLLPAWRGAAPVRHALIAAGDITGPSVLPIEQGLATRPVLPTRAEAISPRGTRRALPARLATAGAPLLVATLDGGAGGPLQAVPPPSEGISVAPNLDPGAAQVNWASPAPVVDRRIRGCTPAAGAWTTREGQRFKIGPVQPRPEAHPLPADRISIEGDTVLVGTGPHPVQLLELSPPGKSWMRAADWARGARLTGGECFDQHPEGTQ